MINQNDFSELPAQINRKRISRSREIWSRMLKNKSAMAGTVVFILVVMVGLLAGVLVDYEQDCVRPDIINKLQSPSREHWMGTDAMGRDMMARLIFGARYSLLVAFASVLMCLSIGLVLGSAAGYFGGKTDDIIMRIIDVFAAVPNLLMAISIAAALGQSLFSMIIAIGISMLPGLTRTIRATVLTIRGQEFIEAGQAMGGKGRQIIIFHILPNCIAPIMIQCTIMIAGAILSTSSLSFLGLGIKPPTPEWGNMLSGGRDFLRTAPHITIFSGAAILITILSANLMGDGLRDAFDPKLKR